MGAEPSVNTKDPVRNYSSERIEAESIGNHLPDFYAGPSFALIVKAV